MLGSGDDQLKLTKPVIQVALLLVLVAISVPSEAQHGQIAQIGFLGTDRSPSTMPREKAFLQALRELGWTEGQNLTVERRYWQNRAERLPALADELVSLNLDAIVTSSGTAARAVKKATNTMSIMIFTSADAVSQGLIASLARPAGNG